VREGQKVKTYLSGEGYRVPSNLTGHVVRLAPGGAWVEHRVSAWVKRRVTSPPDTVIFWACLFYPAGDVEAT
jgi:hypothetical protein